MHAARGCAQQLLLPAAAGGCGGTRASEAARPDFHRPSGLRQPPAPGGAVARGDFGWPPAGPAADEEARAVGGQAETEHQQAASRAQGLSISSARQDDRPAEPEPALAKAGVWAADVTYIPMQQGFLYLVAIIDWATRRVLSWRLSNTLTAGFCVEALSEALARFGKPGIFNTDQGAQFTSEEFTQMLRDHGIEISMDGRGRCHDNIFVERLWWTVSTNGSTCAQRATASSRSAALLSSSTGIICVVRIRRSVGAHRTRLTSADQWLRRHGLPDAMPSRCCEFVDSRLRRSPPDRASAVPYGQAGENAMRFPHLAHRSAAAHKLNSTPQQDRMNLISGNGETSSRLQALAYSSPEAVQTTGTVATHDAELERPYHVIVESN